ncbi:MAG: hypothetical protein QM831_38025 [Kofleriaceae bacterium]
MKLAAILFVAACGTETPISVTSVEDLGAFPLPPDGVGRDGGASGMLGGQILWTFGDTFLSGPNAIDGASVLSATSGWSTPAAPLDLVHSMNGDEPAQLIPYTADEIAANQADALNGYALWPGNLIPVDDSQGIVTFQHVKRSGGSSFAVDYVGTATIHAGETTATRNPGQMPDLFVPQFRVDDRYYAWACESSGFLAFSCKLARSTDLATWEFYDGHTYQSDPANAAYVIDQTSVGPTVARYGGRYITTSCDIVSSTIRIRTADAIEGPWDDGVTIDAGASGILAPKSSSDYNYLCNQHPELAEDGSIVISYSRPTDPFRGEVRLARINLL